MLPPASFIIKNTSEPRKTADPQSSTGIEISSTNTCDYSVSTSIAFCFLIFECVVIVWQHKTDNKRQRHHSNNQGVNQIMRLQVLVIRYKKRRISIAFLLRKLNTIQPRLDSIFSSDCQLLAALP